MPDVKLHKYLLPVRLVELFNLLRGSSASWAPCCRADQAKLLAVSQWASPKIGFTLLYPKLNSIPFLKGSPKKVPPLSESPKSRQLWI